jgi:hypothetical protein
MNVSTANSELASAMARAQEASAAVDQAREDAAEDPRHSGAVVKASRRLSAAIEKTENARAALRVATRREEAEAAAAAKEADRVRGELRKLTIQRRAAAQSKYRGFLETTRADLQEHDRILKGLSQDLREFDIGAYPSRWTSYTLMHQAIQDQLKRLPPVPATKE